MSERICPACKAVVPGKLKFCRGCGGRVEDAPAEAADSGDATMMAAMPRRPAAPDPDPVPANTGDRTVIGAFNTRAPVPEPPTMAPSMEREPMTMAPTPEREPATMVTSPEPEPATMAPTPEREPATMVTLPEPEPATMRVPPEPQPKTEMTAPEPPPAPPPSPSPPPPPPAPTGEETILGALPTPAPPKAPAPVPVEEPEPEPEPITDDFDEEPTVSGPNRIPVPAPPPPPPPVPLPPAVVYAAVAATNAAAAAAGSIRLEHWSPKVKASAVNLAKAETVVGRDRGDLQFPEDAYLSKKHARFYRDEAGRLCVEDLGALNGTYLRLRAPVKLEHRDILFIGRHSFRFELLQYEDKDDRTIEGDPLTRVQGVQGKAPRSRIVKRQEEGFRGLPFFFGTHRYVLGRSDGTHNFAKDDLLSRRHASLEFKDGDYWLEDLGSQNGTFLRLRGPRALEPGDVVKMGDQYFKLPEAAGNG